MCVKCAISKEDEEQPTYPLILALCMVLSLVVVLALDYTVVPIKEAPKVHVMD